MTSTSICKEQDQKNYTEKEEDIIKSIETSPHTTTPIITLSRENIMDIEDCSKVADAKSWLFTYEGKECGGEVSSQFSTLPMTSHGDNFIESHVHVMGMHYEHHSHLNSHFNSQQHLLPHSVIHDDHFSNISYRDRSLTSTGLSTVIQPTIATAGLLFYRIPCMGGNTASSLNLTGLQRTNTRPYYYGLIGMLQPGFGSDATLLYYKQSGKASPMDVTKECKSKYMFPTNSFEMFGAQLISYLDWRRDSRSVSYRARTSFDDSAYNACERSNVSSVSSYALNRCDKTKGPLSRHLSDSSTCSVSMSPPPKGSYTPSSSSTVFDHPILSPSSVSEKMVQHMIRQDLCPKAPLLQRSIFSSSSNSSECSSRLCYKQIPSIPPILPKVPKQGNENEDGSAHSNCRSPQFDRNLEICGQYTSLINSKYQDVHRGSQSLSEDINVTVNHDNKYHNYMTDVRNYPQPVTMATARPERSETSSYMLRACYRIQSNSRRSHSTGRIYYAGYIDRVHYTLPKNMFPVKHNNNNNNSRSSSRAPLKQSSDTHDVTTDFFRQDASDHDRVFPMLLPQEMILSNLSHRGIYVLISRVNNIPFIVKNSSNSFIPISTEQQKLTTTLSSTESSEMCINSPVSRIISPLNIEECSVSGPQVTDHSKGYYNANHNNNNNNALMRRCNELKKRKSVEKERKELFEKAETSSCGERKASSSRERKCCCITVPVSGGNETRGINNAVITKNENPLQRSEEGLPYTNNNNTNTTNTLEPSYCSSTTSTSCLNASIEWSSAHHSDGSNSTCGECMSYIDQSDCNTSLMGDERSDMLLGGCGWNSSSTDNNHHSRTHSATDNNNNNNNNNVCSLYTLSPNRTFSEH